MDKPDSDNYTAVCPECGKEITLTSEWLSKHESYMCDCGTTVYAKNMMIQEEIEIINNEIEKLNKLRIKNKEKD